MIYICFGFYLHRLECDAPIRRVRKRHCDVYTQVRNTLTYLR